MRIQSVNVFNTNLNFGHHTYSKRVNDVPLSEDVFEPRFFKGVAKSHIRTVEKVLNDLQKIGEEEFPNDKVTVFFSAKQSSNIKGGLSYHFALAVNTPAPEGFVRDDSAIPGSLYINNADFYFMDSIHTRCGGDLRYDDIKVHVINGAKDLITKKKKSA